MSNKQIKEVLEYFTIDPAEYRDELAIIEAAEAAAGRGEQ